MVLRLYEHLTLDFVTFDIIALSYVHKQLLPVVRTSAGFSCVSTFDV